MRASEIEALCAKTADLTGLALPWVLHHVYTRAGRPCSRCDGLGFLEDRPCSRCGGSGGRASHASVAEALAWVASNTTKVRSLGERRDHRATEQRQKEVLEVLAWKKEHAELWAFLEDMLPSDFKYSVMSAIESRRVTQRQVEAIQKLVEANRRCDAPAMGTQVDIRVVITGARIWFNTRGQRVFRIDFWVAKGWGGRVETTNEHLVASVQARRTDEGILRGAIAWSKESYAILEDPVTLDLLCGEGGTIVSLSI